MRYTAVLAALVISLMAAGSANRAEVSSVEAEAQDPAYLDRRISLLETRLYSIESSVRSLEQQAMMSRSSPAQPTRDPDVILLRSEVEILKSRLREVECGIAHVDERTLSSAAKEARKRAGAQGQDPCRLDPERPIELSPRR